MSQVRYALCYRVRVSGRSVAAAAREFGVSRKTAYKWLGRYDRATPDATAATVLVDGSRRPVSSPGRVASEVEAAVLVVRDRHGWGPRKIHAVLRREATVTPLPALRTVANVLKRNGRVGPPVVDTPEPQRFERAGPNELWQVDHKGPIEVARRPVAPLSVIDDHSRYALAFAAVPDRTMATAFAVLWDLFGDVGLPDAILCDNAFAALSAGRGSVGSTRG